MRLPTLAAALLATLCLGGPASASQIPAGLWNRDDGLGGIRFADCGGAMCADVVWLKDPNGPAKIGERVLYDMRPVAANEWAGKAHNPEDGRDYDGTLTVEGDHMTTRGCVFGGLICQSVGLTRAP